MSVYRKEIAEVIREPKFCSTIALANAMGSEAKLECGCFVRIEMLIGETTQRIDEISYRTNGCGYMAAAAEAIASRLRGMYLTDLQGCIGGESGSGDRPGCSSAVVKAVQAALANHRVRRVEEFRGEKALICTCFGVTEETIEEFVRSSHTEDVAEVSASLRAGSGCGSCRILIQEIIDANA